jgi:hypothetical protein
MTTGVFVAWKRREVSKGCRLKHGKDVTDNQDWRNGNVAGGRDSTKSEIHQSSHPSAFREATTGSSCFNFRAEESKTESKIGRIVDSPEKEDKSQNSQI